MSTGHELDPSLPLHAVPTVFYDIEMTGLDTAAGHRICELALLRCDAGRETARLATLINPQRPLDPRAAAVNGLTDAELLDAPLFAELAPLLSGFFFRSLRVAHAQPTDDTFLRAELARCGLLLPPGPALDTLTLARRLRLAQRSFGLAALAAELGLPAPTHRALADALTLRQLWQVICRRLELIGVVTLADAQRFERGLLPGQPEPPAPDELAPFIASGASLTIVYSSRSTPLPTRRRIRPLQMVIAERGTPAVRAYCFLRQDIRDFSLQRISAYLPDGWAGEPG